MSTTSASTSRSSSPEPVAAYTRTADQDKGRLANDSLDTDLSNRVNKGFQRFDDDPRERSNNNGYNGNDGPDDMRVQKEYPEADPDFKVDDFFSSVHVRNLSRNITEDHLREIFEEFGTIVHIDYPKDLKTLRNHNQIVHKGYAFIDFNCKKTHDSVIEKMNEAWLDGHMVNVVTSNGTRSAMNISEREDYLRNLQISQEEIFRFFKANIEYTMKKKENSNFQDFRSQFRGRNNNNGFNNNRRKAPVPEDAYFPGGKRPQFNNNNNRGPRELPPDVYRPGRPMADRFRNNNSNNRPFQQRDRRELPNDVYIPGRQPFGGMDRPRSPPRNGNPPLAPRSYNDFNRQSPPVKNERFSRSPPARGSSMSPPPAKYARARQSRSPSFSPPPRRRPIRSRSNSFSPPRRRLRSPGSRSPLPLRRRRPSSRSISPSPVRGGRGPVRVSSTPPPLRRRMAARSPSRSRSPPPRRGGVAGPRKVRRGRSPSSSLSPPRRGAPLRRGGRSPSFSPPPARRRGGGGRSRSRSPPPKRRMRRRSVSSSVSPPRGRRSPISRRR